MKTLHKPLAIIFALLALTLFAACSSDSDDGSISTGLLANGATWTGIDSEGDTVGTLVFKFNGKVSVSLNIMGFEFDDEYTYYVIDGSEVWIVLDEESGMEIPLMYSSGELLLPYSSSYTITFTK